MRKIASLVLVMLICLMMAVPAFAVTPVEGLEHCYYNYPCNKSVLDVTVDGKFSEGEWDDAVALVINDDTIEDYGRWQSANSLPASEFGCTYRFKWDADNLYVLEVRNDAHYVSDFAGNDYDALNPWMLDGTAIFFCDNDDPTTANRCDIKFNSYVEELKAPSVYIGNGDNTGFRPEKSGDSGCEYAGTVNGTTVIFEMKMPWALMDYHLTSAIAEGTIFRFTPIIMTRDTVDDYAQWDGSSYAQINFHDCINVAGEDASGAENPEYWAAFTLSAANYTAPVVEAPVEEAPVEAPVETPAEAPAETPAAPVTADFGIAVSAIVLAVACAGIVISKKKH